MSHPICWSMEKTPTKKILYRTEMLLCSSMPGSGVELWVLGRIFGGPGQLQTRSGDGHIFLRKQCIFLRHCGGNGSTISDGTGVSLSTSVWVLVFDALALLFEPSLWEMSTCLDLAPCVCLVWKLITFSDNKLSWNMQKKSQINFYLRIFR